MLTVDISLPDIDELKALVTEGQEKGYLTFDEVAAAMEEIELTKELFNITFQLHTGRLENTAKLSLVRKDIAKVKTVLREKRG